MKKSILGALSALLILGLAVAAAAIPPVRANIPFAFHVGDVTLPAGEYVIRALDQSVGFTYMIQSRSSSESYFVPTAPGQKNYNDNNFQLTFTKYGASCFLSKIRTGSTEITTAKGRAERELSQLKSDKAPVIATLILK